MNLGTAGSQLLGFQVNISVLLVHTTIGISSNRNLHIALLLELICNFFPIKICTIHSERLIILTFWQSVLLIFILA